jgi:hypothetical protein
LRRFSRAHNVTPADLAESSARSIHVTNSGDVIVTMRQQHEGLDVYGSDVKVLMRGDHSLVAISGHPVATGGAQTRVARTPQDALAAALSDRFGAAVYASSIEAVAAPDGRQRFQIAAGSDLRMPEAAPVRAILYPSGGGLIAAYVTDFFAGTADSNESAAFRYVIAADDGRVLERRDLTVYEAGPNPPSAPPPAEFHYRVFADPATQRPLDGPQIGFSPHPTGNPDGTTIPLVAANLVTMGGFNHPPSGVPDPWLAPDALETSGNNADAYTDFSNPDGLTPGIDFRADLTSPRTFDRLYDFTRESVATIDQSKAAITNAFYTVNWLHDYWYDSGFDEVAGNAQLSNYGRGGVEGDPMRVEVQDNFLGGSRNNANMSTPEDGMRPRMQMYTWSGPTTVTLTFTPGGTVPPGTASFGATNFDITALAVLANDGAGVTSDACTALSASPAGSCSPIAAPARSWSRRRTVSQCGAMSEGWGDFIALHTIARDGDNLNGAFPLAVYATSGSSDPFFGIRREPYSVDFTKDGLTFKHIATGVPLPPPSLDFGDNAEVHNAGEVWTTMLWEGYVALQKARGAGDSFDDVRRRMADYVVAGLKMAPSNATYTEQRDAILMAAASAGDDHHGKKKNPGAGDLLTLAKAFARRGAGTCAISPPRESLNFAGVVESFDVRANVAVGEIRIEEGHSCDGDGIIDAGERGRIVVPVMNSGPVDLVDTTVSISSPTSGLSIKKGSARIARLAPFTTIEVEFEVELDKNFSGVGQLQVDAIAANDSACEPSASASAFAWINVDEVQNASTIDNVETPTTPWTTTGADASEIWSRVDAGPFNRAWFGLDFPAPSDTALESPALQVGTSAPFVITFDHRFGFETDGGVAPFFDGGMIEISRNGGPFEDISAFVDPGYGGTLFVGSDNPLGGRQAFVGRNASFPARDTVSLNLGTALAGQTVRIRFRIGTDAASSDIGWEIDNIGFQGITNKPFPAFIADQSKCRGVPKK